MERPGVPDNIKKVYFNLQGFNQYGLLHDDVLHETEIIQEAISRLPPEMQVNLGSGRFFFRTARFNKLIMRKLSNNSVCFMYRTKGISELQEPYNVA